MGHQHLEWHQSMVSSEMQFNLSCSVNLVVNNKTYPQFNLLILPHLCSPVILGRDFMALHQSIKFNFGGPHSTITVGALEAIEINPPRLFDRLTEDIKPIATPTRRQSLENQNLIRKNIQQLLQEELSKVLHPHEELKPLWSMVQARNG